MGFKPRKEATTHAVTDGDTLQSLAAQAGVSVDELCQFNFGTTRVPEVNRALVEIVGCRHPGEGSGAYCALSASDATRGSGKLLLPRPFARQGLATGQTHTLHVDRRRPMPAVSITALDKWFIPGAAKQGGEECRVRYSLEGIKLRADKVTVEVHGSNYCAASLDQQGNASFTAVAGAVPLWTRDQPAERSAPGGFEHAVEGYRGQSTAASGMLKPRAGKERFINVAFSPYTVLVRFYKSDADKQARLLIGDFWPRWNIEGVLEPASLNIKWKVENCSKLKHGQLLVVDRGDAVVLRKPLQAGDLSAGDHELPWDGRLDDGSFVTRDQMPYRVQVQAHSEMDQDVGLALAAMHTEVRLHVDPDTGKHLIKEAHKDPNTLVFRLAPIVPKVPAEGSGTRWLQYQLARGGFHPGPVDGDHGPLTRRAVREFQRSVAANAAAPYQRLNPTGQADAETTEALKRLAPGTRPVWGDPVDMKQMDDVSVASRLRDKANLRGIIVWVDDRHCYTQANPGRPFLDARMFMDDYHGVMSSGDDRIKADAAAIARPFLPLSVDLPLLSRAVADQGLQATTRQLNEATRQAIGPLRVDWTVGEIGEELRVIDTGHPDYDPTRTRSRKWIDEATKGQQAMYRGLPHRNCPVANGGIRPAQMSDYYKEALAHGALSLEPWRGLDDTGTHSICSLVHDDLGQGDDQLHPTHVGQAGVYLRPSTIGGDGYRYRAQVRFDPLPGGASQFPNREVLQRRYPSLPQAHSGRLRVWRKSSMRGYLAWCPRGDSHWPGHRDPCARYYRAAYLHFEDEPGPNPRQAHRYDLASVVSEAEYRTCVATNVVHADWAPLSVSFDLEQVWPYCHLPHLGIPQGGPGTTLGNFRTRVINGIFSPTWRAYRKDLLHLLLRKVEQTSGRMRGHLLVEFKSSQTMTIEEYRCSDPACNATRAEVTTNCSPADTLVGQPCPTGTPGHVLVRHNPPNTVAWASIPLPAVGVSMGATWLFTSGGADVWAHELGHHRHLEHAPAYPGVQGSATAHPLGRSARIAGVWHKCGAAPGAKAAQHDGVLNPALAAEPATDPVHPDKDRGWDRDCIMSYTHGEPLYFCGKCLLKNRGWAVEGLPDLGGDQHD